MESLEKEGTLVDLTFTSDTLVVYDNEIEERVCGCPIKLRFNNIQNALIIIVAS